MKRLFVFTALMSAAWGSGALACEADLSIVTVSSDGTIVKLDDGSVWEVEAGDAPTSSIWLSGEEIVACDDKLINTDDDEEVSATRIK